MTNDRATRVLAACGRRLAGVALLALAVLMTSVAGPAPFGVDPAFAQRQPGLFELLFDRRKREERRQRMQQQRQPQQAAPTRPRVRRSQPRRGGAAATGPSAEALERSDNARKLLVVGDFIAAGMANGLVEAYAQSPNVVVDSRTNGSSGLVRDDFYDWPEQIGPILAELEPDFVVVLLGSNDRQPLRVDGANAKPLSDPWRAEYARRVEAFLAQTSAAEIPVVWVGSPPFRFRAMSADILAINEIHRTAVEAANGRFVDIWDGFVDANGHFSAVGENIKGQTVRLRKSDGINFTAAGRRKLAFYAERALMELLGGDGLPQVTGLGPQDIPIMRLPPLQTEADLRRINPIALNDPDLDGGAVLLGDTDVRANAPNPLQARSVRQMLVEQGVPPPAQPGRAGNFALPPAGAAQLPTPAVRPPG